MQPTKYTVLLHPDEHGGYTVTVPALTGVVTQGETLDEALELAKDAITLYLEDLMSDGEPSPAEQQAPQLHTVTVQSTGHD